MKGRYFWLIFVFLVVLLGVGGFIWRRPILEGIGARLQAQGAPLPPPWDAIFVLSGRPYERSLRGAELYREHPTIVVALGGAYNDDLLAIGIQPAQECAFTQSALRRLCVPDTAILTECVGTSTLEEVLHIRTLCVQRQWRRIVIVSSPFHGGRIERLAKRWLSNAGIEWSISVAKPLHYHPERWWYSEIGMLTVFEEYAKTLYYWYKGYF